MRDLAINLLIAAFVLSIAGCNVWLRFFGPCARSVASMPGWCLGLYMGGHH